MNYRKLPEPQGFHEPFSLRAAWQVWRQSTSGGGRPYCLWLSPYAPWNFRELKAVFIRPFQSLKSLIRIFGVQALRLLRTATPIIAIDNEDARTIARHNIFLLDQSELFL